MTPGAPREHGAAATRTAILDAAERLFAERGYPATTIAEIARHAGVGTNTVYVGFGNKPSIVAALIHRASTWSTVQDATDGVARASTGRQVIDEIAEGTRRTHERHHRVVTLGLDTANVDPVIAEAQQAAMDSYRERLRWAVERIEELGDLAATLSVPDAVDLLWFYLGLSPWRVLIELGWSWDRAQRFLGAEAKDAVLA